MFASQLRILAALLFILCLTGSQCTFVAWSGDRDDDEDDDDPNAGLIVVIRDGRFVDAPVEGLNYASGVVSGVTERDGTFSYQEHHSVRFSIGDIELGDATAGRSVATPLDLVPGGAIDTPAVINIARLLQSLDATPDDAIIVIPASVRSQAVRSNEALAGVIDDLDFYDETAFVNSASHLVAVLTADYPFTAVLVDARTAQERLAESIQVLP